MLLAAAMLLASFQVGQSGADARSVPDVRSGAYCLYVALKALELPAGSFSEFEHKAGKPDFAGYTLPALETAAAGCGAVARTVHTDLAALARLDHPVFIIAQLHSGYFVNVDDIRPDAVFVTDPPDAYEMPRSQFELLWSGDALLVSRHPIPDLRPAAPAFGPLLLGVLALLALVAIALLVVKTIVNGRRAGNRR